MVSSGSVESLDRTSNASERVEVKRKIAIKHHSYSMSSSNRSNTPTGKSVIIANIKQKFAHTRSLALLCI